MRSNKLKMKDNKFLLTAAVTGAIFLLSAANVAAQNDFPAFWKNFTAAVAKGDKTAVAALTRFPLEMPAFQRAVKSRADFTRRYGKIFNGEANAAQCFAKAVPEKSDETTYEVYCPFKATPDDWENTPVKYYFTLTKTGWKFAGLDNINE